MTSSEAVCSVCGQANECDLVAGKSSCWCFFERVDRELLAWLAANGLRGSCLCRVCAVGEVRSPCVGQ